MYVGPLKAGMTFVYNRSTRTYEKDTTLHIDWAKATVACVTLRSKAGEHLGTGLESIKIIQKAKYLDLVP